MPRKLMKLATSSWIGSYRRLKTKYAAHKNMAANRTPAGLVKIKATENSESPSSKKKRLKTMLVDALPRRRHN
jgi:hypothetical protein